MDSRTKVKMRVVQGDRMRIFMEIPLDMVRVITINPWTGGIFHSLGGHYKKILISQVMRVLRIPFF